MKKVVLIQIMLFIFVSTIQAQDIEALTYAQTQDIGYYINVKDGTKVLSYTTKDGAVLKVGDTISLGRPTSSESYNRTRAYSTDGGYTSAAGRSTNNAKFETIIMGKPNGFGNIMMALSAEAAVSPGIEYANENVVISEMNAVHDGSKKKPLYIYLLLGEPNGRAFGINKYMSTSDIEKSILLGELIPGNMPLNREQAIAKLKESKELLELDMITQEEYDKIKTDLTPIIKGE